MAIHKIGDYSISMTLMKEKYDMAKWDYEIKKGDEVIVEGCDRMTVSFDEKDAIIEMLLDDSQIEAELESTEPIKAIFVEMNQELKASVTVGELNLDTNDVEKAHKLAKTSAGMLEQVKGKEIYYMLQQGNSILASID